MQERHIGIDFTKTRKIFSKKSGLFAQQFNININKAYVQQAKYWDNPVLNTDQNIYVENFSPQQ
jgi:cobalt-zinc-cadmium efflux system outer membrane protein